MISFRDGRSSEFFEGSIHVFSDGMFLVVEIHDKEGESIMRQILYPYQSIEKADLQYMEPKN